jgi:hypothetical protein
VPIFKPKEPTAKELMLDRAQNTLLRWNQTTETIMREFLAGRESIFGIAGFTVEQAQQHLDAIDSIDPGAVARGFQSHGALGEFIKTVAPELITDDLLKPAMEYKVDMSPGYPRIVLVGERYPTEPVD